MGLDTRLRILAIAAALSSALRLQVKVGAEVDGTAVVGRGVGAGVGPGVVGGVGPGVGGGVSPGVGRGVGFGVGPGVGTIDVSSVKYRSQYSSSSNAMASAASTWCVWRPLL